MSSKSIDIALLDAFDCDRETLQRLVEQALYGADDGELYIEHTETEQLAFDNGRLKSGTYNTGRGFGLRSVLGEAAGYAHAGDLSKAALERAAKAVRATISGSSGTWSEAPRATNARYYGDENPLRAPDFEAKAALLAEIDAYARSLDPCVQQVSVSLSTAWKVVEILRPGGFTARDVRPQVSFNISIVAGKAGRHETGSFGSGGRHDLDALIAESAWKSGVSQALRRAQVNLESVPAPAGTFDVVLGPGWPGIMLHEAVGHGLEGDFNRKKTSAFSGLMGEMVANENVTVVDDGTYNKRRGSVTIDDEGTAGQETVLIENGRLVGYMQDRQNARLMGVESTGNGRRQSYAHPPMPRMTNTLMRAGNHDHQEILESVSDGIYAVSFGGGQVDITSGKYVFNCTEAYRIRGGKVEEPLKGAMMIGSGPADMKRVSMVGNNLELDTGMGNCGKAGQWVPVGVGQPTTRINGITIGGTQT